MQGKIYIGNNLVLPYLGDTYVIYNENILDVNVQLFLNATGITDVTTISALNTLVLSLKSNGLWSKMLAVYPFVGDTDDTQKYNLVDAQDTDSAFRITWGSGITHSSNGIQLSGLGGAITNLDVGTDVDYDDISAGVYIRTDNRENVWDLGAASLSPSFRCLILTARNLDSTGKFATKAGGVDLDYTNNTTTSQGFYQVSRSGTGGAYLNARNSTIGNPSESDVTSYTGTVCFGQAGVPAQGLSTRQYAFGYVGSNLTSGELQDYYTIVQTFQTSLGREV